MPKSRFLRKSVKKSKKSNIIKKRDSGHAQNDGKVSEMTKRTRLLFVVGFLLLATSLLWHFNQTIQLAFFTPKVVAVAKSHPIPTRIIIPKVNIDLPIEETAITNGSWQVSQTAISHLTASARPEEKGTIILYSHNTDDRFGPIRWLNKGEKIEIRTAGGKNHAYMVSQTLKVSPSQMDILTQNKGETLILYTCDGFADLQRFVILASPI